MKFVFSFLITVFSCVLSMAQGTLKYNLQVTDKNHTALAGMTVTATETTTLATTKSTTDKNGFAYFELSNGNQWNISIGQIPNASVAAHWSDANTTMNDVYAYDYAGYLRQKTQDPNRSNDGYKVVNEIVLENEAPAAGKSLLVLLLYGYGGQPLHNIRVEAVDTKGKICYQSKTNRQGKVCFMLPNNTNYDIDVENCKNFYYADFGDKSTRHNVSLAYFPTTVTETVKGDTVFQTLDASAAPSTERALITVTVNGGDKGGVNELTSLRSISNNKVYFAKTNASRKAIFLVPAGQVYMVDFEFERNVDAVTAINPRGLTQGRVGVTYRPDPRLQFPERYIPTPATLVLKQYESFLTNTYPRAKDKPFELQISPITKVNKNAREALFKLTLTGSDTYGQGARLPLNIALVLDKSGSMYCDGRMEALKKSLEEIKNLLLPQDEVSIVLFDDDAVAVPQPIDAKSTVQTVIDNYTPGGGTDIFKGLQLGVKGVRSQFNNKKENKVILLTDGYDINPPQDVTDYVEKQYQEGIEFSAIGMGEYYNQALLELIARKGNGSLEHVTNSTTLPGCFTKQFGRYTAKDIKVEIYHDEKLIFSNLFGFLVKSAANKKVTFDIRSVGAGTNHLAFLKFKLEEASAAVEAKPLTVKISYFDVLQNKEVNIEQKVQLQWTDETNTEWLISQEEKKLYAIAIMNQSLKVMAEAHAINDSKTAKAAVESGIKQMREIYPSQEPSEVRAIFEEMNQYIENFVRMEANKNRE